MEDYLWYFLDGEFVDSEKTVTESDLPKLVAIFFKVNMIIRLAQGRMKILLME